MSKLRYKVIVRTTPDMKVDRYIPFIFNSIRSFENLNDEELLCGFSSVLNEISHTILLYVIEGDEGYGDLDVLNTVNGKLLRDFIDAGVPLEHLCPIVEKYSLAFTELVED